ncbi:hypothetical protein M438DRAFT_359953 [Aureobasidium pullulans EXF-150]|uniref:Uncharacterized protein n=1 Tax=Aureobasidium pullulans EXF-150 TaxID=1043002 RepID=A0A074XAV3_AURPU|nr:uncharacterized protein M438DRAFT_359953 [Aureobasidium pullulans EXF-150]KEQ79172.1 hypothetical protein M438DRAFT_359953 [Aureobasidium pullulans EXF-150]
MASSTDREIDGRVDRLGCKIGERRYRVCRGRGRKRHRIIVGNGEVVRGGFEETIKVGATEVERHDDEDKDKDKDKDEDKDEDEDKDKYKDEDKDMADNIEALT